MNLIKGALPYFALPFVISLILVPVAKQIGFKLGMYADYAVIPGYFLV